ncbi:UDP-galactopyranose mutase [Sphingomonas sp. BK069]|uniref:UDP-galactopyranose mutase n=1 Tax=Sphingomonas sp. BK069 TaxID=2586979 RepID=UPI0017E06345|nr:UDP-galactopyranose mutase [Sphingomonas sp. BK069]MBB3349019.1 UDP-galactopyranose mutase [Sphingomonas sp. BK069]
MTLPSPPLPHQDSRATASDDEGTLICFSHLRWDFVFQRPQHLMSRFARARQVLFWEEPIVTAADAGPRVEQRRCANTGVTVCTPHLPAGLAGDAVCATLRDLLDAMMAAPRGPVVRWYYTPMMLPFSEHLAADCIVYDCMDELSQFKNAPHDLLPLEQRLLDQADLVFTGGHSLYEAKRERHDAVHAFPSSVDVAHFAAARAPGATPADQSDLPAPRLGFYGVIDERMDLGLLAALADARPDYQIVILGPVVKISPDDLPRRANLHYPGGRGYAELPDYLRGWDVALMPFAINEATRFISPTKTPEYLAAGRPVVSTPVTDVVRSYGDVPGVFVAAEAPQFAAACDAALALARAPERWLPQVDALLARGSWDQVQSEMAALIDAAIARGSHVQPIVSPVAWPVTKRERYDVMVVGAGFAGAVMAERLAAGSGKRVLVVDRRPHVAGNAYDHLDAGGVLIHQYGPHIFHTNSSEIVDYLSRFTDWRPYEHRVLADVRGTLVPMPINRTTLNALYGLALETEAEAAAFLANRAEPVDVVRTSADVVISAVGRDLYETFFQGYTRKQWGLDPSELDKSVTARVPTRTNTDDRYFTDSFQAMPRDGYTRMFERMLDHPNIDVLLGVDYHEARDAYPHDHLVFTGPIDEYFGYRYGQLPYRSLRFQHETLEQEWHQPVAVVNYPSPDVPYTRVTEYKYLTGQQAPNTSITYEYPSATGDPYYPIPRAENQELFKRYEALAIAEAGVSFVGRLATYRYYNMDQVVGQALATYRRLAERWREPDAPRVEPLLRPAAA